MNRTFLLAFCLSCIVACANAQQIDTTAPIAMIRENLPDDVVLRDRGNPDAKFRLVEESRRYNGFLKTVEYTVNLYAATNTSPSIRMERPDAILLFRKQSQSRQLINPRPRFLLVAENDALCVYLEHRENPGFSVENLIKTIAPLLSSDEFIGAIGQSHVLEKTPREEHLDEIDPLAGAKSGEFTTIVVLSEELAKWPAEKQSMDYWLERGVILVISDD